MKKILFLINTLNVGGAEKVLIDFVNNLSKDTSNYDITLQTIIDTSPLKHRLSNRIQYKSIIKTSNKILKRILMHILCFKVPASIIHKVFIGNKYDYEIAFLEGIPTKIIGASKNNKSIKYSWVHTDLNTNYNLSKVFGNKNNQIDCYNKFDKIICVSSETKSSFIKQFGLKDKVILKYNLIDEDEIKSKLSAQPQQHKNFHIVSVGRLEYVKGFDRLLTIISRLKKDNIICDLTIVGDGSKSDELKQYTIDNNIADNVTFIGFSDNPYQYMQCADLIVCPSRIEGFSTVVVEAILLGKPVVVSDCAGMKEILGQSEYGLIASNDTDELYNAVKNMICNDELRQGYAQKARLRSTYFAKNRRLAEIMDLFE